MVDVSASGNFGSTAQSKREMAAELASVLAFSAIRNSDKVGLILFSDRIEQYIPPKKGRRHVLRVVREILYFQPQGRGTDMVGALDFANRVTRRRAVSFLISDFQTTGDQAQGLADLRRAIRLANKRHDLVALHIEDRREHELPDVGILAIEDAETGEVLEIDTANPQVRTRFAQLADQRAAALRHALNAEAVDSLELENRSVLRAAAYALFQIPHPEEPMNFPKTLVFLIALNLTVATEFACAQTPAAHMPRRCRFRRTVTTPERCPQRNSRRHS